MTSKHSSPKALKAQADKIAATLKAAERGDIKDPKVTAAKEKGNMKVGIVMDDKIITVDMPFETIRTTSEAGLSEYILSKMRESRDTLN